MTKSPILTATDLLRINPHGLTFEELSAHIQEVIDSIMALVQSSMSPGFRSVTARISAKHLEDRLRAHLAEAVLTREAFIQTFAVADEQGGESDPQCLPLMAKQIARRM